MSSGSWAASPREAQEAQRALPSTLTGHSAQAFRPADLAHSQARQQVVGMEEGGR